MFPRVVIAVVDEGTKIPVLDSVDKVCEAITEAQIAANVENQRRTRSTGGLVAASSVKVEIISVTTANPSSKQATAYCGVREEPSGSENGINNIFATYRETSSVP